MDHDDPEKRIAELENQLAGQKRTPEPGRNAAFSDASRSQGAYDRGEVDAFLERVEATLRDPTTPNGVTAAEIHAVAFSEPPIGQRGYDEGEVDLFLDRAKIELSRRVSGQSAEESIHCLLYPYGGWDPQTPVRAIDMDNHAVRVIDLTSNALIALVSRVEVTATPAQHGGIPVVVVDGPGLETMAIAPHPPPGEWGKRRKSEKPAYLAVEEDWLRLAETFGMASDLVDEYTPQNFREHVFRFFGEGATTRGPTTWRTPLMFGLLVFVPGCIYGSPLAAVIGAVMLIVAALAWRLKWEI